MTDRDDFYAILGSIATGRLARYKGSNRRWRGRPAGTGGSKRSPQNSKLSNRPLRLSGANRFDRTLSSR